MYIFENWNETKDSTYVGKDAAWTKADNNRTNYYIKKYVFMGWNPNDASVSTTTHLKFIVRWSQMMLTFAEAANKVGGPNDVKYGMSAFTAIQYMRNRKTYDGANGVCTVAPPAVPTAAQDPYLVNTAAAGKDAFDALIRNERRIELCFEGLRFYDLRRWTTDTDWTSVINKSVHGAYITRSKRAPFTYTYNFNYEAEKRTFPSPYNPIPYTEILRMSNLIQNQGWDGWN